MKEILYDLLLGQGGSGALTLADLFLNLAAAGAIAVLIYISYRSTHSGAVYSARFNVSLVMLTLITTTVMCVIGNNIALSLGMVGALSIVRFRTAIKDPRDTAYIFWTVAVGICCGVSDYVIAIVGSMFIFVFLIVFGFVRDNERILIILRGSGQAVQQAEQLLEQYFDRTAKLRTSTTGAGGAEAECIYEISAAMLRTYGERNGDLRQQLAGVDGLDSIHIIRQEDEITQ